ncbi:MAG: T9SS type A sorting domain-containing protein [Flavobacteriales bacterium]
MRTLLCTIAIALGSASVAQCVHDPLITPDSLALCPGDTATLSTQVGDSYQWYRNQTLIPGAMGQTLLLNGSQDAGSTFEVLVTTAGCAEFSPLVYIGGYSTVQPQVFWSGNAIFTDTAGLHFCEGSVAFLILQPPHDTNISWARNGITITGATDDSLEVIANGNYLVTASVAACPGTSATLGSPFSVLFEPYLQPAIVWDDTLLCADPPGNSYQWYINGLPVFSGTGQCISASFVGGSYTVDVEYGSPCETMSDPLVVVGVQDPPVLPRLLVWPNPAHDRAEVSSASGVALGDWALVDLAGRQMRAGSTSEPEMTIDLGDLAPGTYILRMQAYRTACIVVI